MLSVSKISASLKRGGTSHTNGGTITERLLAFCETPRTRAELEQFTGFSRFYMMSKLVKPLLESGQSKIDHAGKAKKRKAEVCEE